MEHLILRCKHCHKEYTYCTYGNGPEYGTEEGCSKEYCAECQKAIDEALSRIPVKCQMKPVEVDMPEMLPILADIKRRLSEDNGKFPNVTRLLGGTYDNVEIYTYQGKTYRVEYNDDTPDDKHLFVEMEYDLVNKKVTEKYWRAKDYQETYYYARTFGSLFRKMKKVTENKLPEPSGQLLYMSI